MMTRTFAFAHYLPAESSWWIDASRQYFSEQALRQQDRMSQGRGADCVNPLPRPFADKQWDRPAQVSLVEAERQLMRLVEER